MISWLLVNAPWHARNFPGSWLQRKRKNLNIKLNMKENESCHEIQDEVIKIEEQLGREAENYLVEVQEKCKNFSDLM